MRSKLKIGDTVQHPDFRGTGRVVATFAGARVQAAFAGSNGVIDDAENFKKVTKKKA